MPHFRRSVVLVGRADPITARRPHIGREAAPRAAPHHALTARVCSVFSPVVLAGVHGKSVRALAIAPYDSKVLVIGALDGVFRSKNGVNSWEQISPASQTELKNIE